MAVVPAHELIYKDPEREAAFIERRLAAAAELVRAKPSNLGPFLIEALRLFGFRARLGRPASTMLTALELARDFGLGLFQRGSVDSSDLVRFSVAGEQVEVAGGSTTYNSALRWLESFGVSSILRDRAALERLCAYDPDKFQGVGSYDGYHVSLARALRELHAPGLDGDAQLERAALEVDQARVAPERARRIGGPLIALARAVRALDAQAFNPCLCEALQGYRALHEANDDARRAEAAIPVLHLGLCAIAHDRGLRVEVQSDYLPDWLVRGALPRPDAA